MKKIALLSSSVALLAVTACGGGGHRGTDLGQKFRLLEPGDSWTFTQETTFTAPGITPISYVHTNVVTVVENPTDATGHVYGGLALKSEYTQVSGPDAPIGTEYELFTQDPATHTVYMQGNITGSGAFIPKSGTLYLGSYDVGYSHTYDGDVNDNLITFQGLVTGQEELKVLNRSLPCWVVDVEEVGEPNGADFHSNGNQSQEINPTLGSRARSVIDFDIGAPFLGHLAVTSTITDTNINL